jgi:methylated-DNA-protein-cysteine methyltransferase-like protein
MAASASEQIALHRERIWQVVHGIPAGKVASYGQVAELAGLPRAARLVGRVLSQLPQGSTLPWHRVIKSSGEISFPKGSKGFREQRERLLTEGVEVRNGRVAKKFFLVD